MNVLKKPVVLKIVGVTRTTLQTMIENKEFPAPIRLSARAIGWIDTEVQGWLDSKIAERDAKAGAS